MQLSDKNRGLPNSAVIAKNLPLHLTLDQMANPGQVIERFFQSLTLDDARELMTSVFDSAIGLPDDCLEGFSRHDLQFSKVEVIRFFEAAYWLNRCQNNQIPEVTDGGK